MMWVSPKNIILFNRKIREKKAEMILRNYEYILAFPYFLILARLLPAREIYLTIASICTWTLLFIWHIFTGFSKINRKPFIAFLMLFLWAAMTVLFNIIRLESHSNFIYDANTIVTLGTVFLLFSTHNNLFNKENVRNAIKAMIAIGIISSLINIIENYQDVFTLAAVTQVYDVKFTGLFLGRNQFGWFIYLCIIGCMLLKSFYREKINAAVFALLGVNLFFTFSRAAILATVIFILIFWIDLHKPKRLMLLLMVALLGLYLYFFTEIRVIIDRFLIRSDFGSSGRFARWDKLLEALFESNEWLTGVSPARFKELLLSIGIEQIDNAYLEILASYGIGGLSLYLGLFVYLLSLVKRADLTQNKAKLIVAAIISFAILSFFESLLLFESGLIQWSATLLIVGFPKFCLGYELKNRRNAGLECVSFGR